jgi:hypothetical protein
LGDAHESTLKNYMDGRIALVSPKRRFRRSLPYVCASPPQDEFAVANRTSFRDLRIQKNSSAESLIHLRHNFDWSLGLKRASALVYSAIAYLGDAPGLG